MSTEESVLKTEIRKLLSARGAFWSNVAGGAYSKPGDPDIIACYRGLFIGIEAKTYKGKLANLQKVRRDMILKAGGRYILARNTAVVEEMLDEIDAEEEKQVGNTLD